ncbi:hypothetical protein WDM69_04420 [Moraxella lincolnii]|uniref:hypothetical protein n=1 Tax=Lwoffella lincolnii TaxID=90241 RepID=UPI0030D2CCB2
MSISLRTAKMTIVPKYYEDKQGKKRFSADIIEPVNYPINLSHEGGNSIPQLEALLQQCADDYAPVEITYVMGKDNWGKQSLTLFDAVPEKKPVNPTHNNKVTP